MNLKKTFFNWSSGKDSSLALYKLLQDSQYSVDLLVTTVSMPQDRISMHGVRRSLLIKQFEAMEIPYRIIEIPQNADLKAYDTIMNAELEQLRAEGFKYAAYGDIFLDDLKKYREDRLHAFGMKAVFPLWNMPTDEVVKQYLQTGFKAVVVSANAALFKREDMGKTTGNDFFSRLPCNVDVCGENGEYHTFCFFGPIFKKNILFQKGDVVLREYEPTSATPKEALLDNGQLGFWFRDLI